MPKNTCPNCDLNASENSINCDKCHKLYHFKCTTLSSYEIQLHIKNEYKSWKCDACVDKYCNNCNKLFTSTNLDSICCDLCLRWYHYICADLTLNDFNKYCVDETLIWKCKLCINKFCKKCNKNISRIKNISCNICKNKFDQKCSGLAKPIFQDITDRNEKWYCRECYCDIFPFHQLENKKLENLFEKKR